MSFTRGDAVELLTERKGIYYYDFGWFDSREETLAEFKKILHK